MNGYTDSNVVSHTSFEFFKIRKAKTGINVFK
jgi:hypothetical protein